MALEDSYLRWKRARDARRSSGAQRASAEEIAALEELLRDRESAGEEAWTAMAGQLTDDDPDLCRCGHHVALHHERSGGCFHVVGCATACPCTAYARD